MSFSGDAAGTAVWPRVQTNSLDAQAVVKLLMDPGSLSTVPLSQPKGQAASEAGVCSFLGLSKTFLHTQENLRELKRHCENNSVSFCFRLR